MVPVFGSTIRQSVSGSAIPIEPGLRVPSMGFACVTGLASERPYPSDDFASRFLFEFAHDLDRHRGGPGVAEPDRGEVERIHFRMGHQGDVDSRDSREDRRPLLPYGLYEFVCIKARHWNNSATCVDGQVEGHCHAEHMKEGQHGQEAFLAAV